MVKKGLEKCEAKQCEIWSTIDSWTTQQPQKERMTLKLLNELLASLRSKQLSLPLGALCNLLVKKLLNSIAKVLLSDCALPCSSELISIDYLSQCPNSTTTTDQIRKAGTTSTARSPPPTKQVEGKLILFQLK